MARRQLRPDCQGALSKRALRIANQESHAGALLDAKPLAGRTPAERAVERKVMRIERLKTPAATIAGKVQTELLYFPLRLRLAVVHVGDVQDAAPHLQRRLHRI